MKHLHGSAEAAVDLPIGDCLAFLASLEDYPSWYPDVVKGVNVVELGDDGLPQRAETKLHLAYGPVSRDLELLLAVRLKKPELVELSHVSRGQASGASFDATWRLSGTDSTQLELELDATMPVPRFVPLGGVGDSFADGFMRAAVAGLQSR